MTHRVAPDTDADTEIHRPEAVLTLWAGFLLAPVAFLSGMLATYALSATPCGQRHDLLLHCIHAASIAIGTAGFLAAWSAHRITRHSEGAGALGPGVRFFARISLGTNTLFLLAMLVQWVPNFVYGSC